MKPLERKTIEEIQSAGMSPTPKDHKNSCDTSVTIEADDSSTLSVHDSKKKQWLHLMMTFSRAMIFSITGFIISPLVAVFYVLIRLLLFTRHGESYYSTTQLKLFIRALLCIAIGVGAFGVFFGITFGDYDKTNIFPEFDRVINRLPVGLYALIFGICCFSLLLPSILRFFIPYYRFPLDHMGSGLYVREGLLEIIDCFLFWWMESKVAKHVPLLKDSRILDLHIQRWIKVSVVVIVGYNAIVLFCHAILWVLRKLVPKKLDPSCDTRSSSSFSVIEQFKASDKYLVYSFNGIKHSITFLLTSLLLLLIWVLYFGFHLNDTPRAKEVIRIGNSTFISVLICSFFCLIKTCVLLSWEAIAVYNRLSSKILEGGNQLYFLGIIGRLKHDIFYLRYNDTPKQHQAPQDADKQVEILNNGNELLSGRVVVGGGGGGGGGGGKYDTPLTPVIRSKCFQQIVQCVIVLSRIGDRSKSKLDDEDEWPNKQGVRGSNDEQVKCFTVKKLSRHVKERVKDILFMQDSYGFIPTIDCIQQVAQFLLTSKETLLKEKYTSDILLTLERVSKNGIIEENVIEQLIQGRNNAKGKMNHEWDYFRDQLDSEEISLEAIGAWMDRARTNCLFVANTLSSAKEVADCLNKIISLLTIAATFVMWLLLTGLATTKVFVLIASPLLAATFIFGDTCKTLFQGIIFTYVVHPFDVGDLCKIDDKMMEVRRIGVWKTIFSKVDTQEEVMYANSQLSNKDIINHKTEFYWNDCVEIDVAPLNKEKIMNLEEKIKKYLNDNKEKFTPGHNCVAALTTGDNIKISISFKHNVNPINTTTFSECLKQKQELRSEFVLHVHDLLEKSKNERPKLKVDPQNKLKRRKFQWQLYKSLQSK